MQSDIDIAVDRAIMQLNTYLAVDPCKTGTSIWLMFGRILQAMKTPLTIEEIKEIEALRKKNRDINNSKEQHYI